LCTGDIVVEGTLLAHKHAGAIEAAGAIVCHLSLPNSQDINPVNAIWSKIKENMRTFMPRTAEPLLDAIGVALRAMTTMDVEGWFAHFN